MMALFSPSEGKRQGGTGTFRQYQTNPIGGAELRKPLIQAYEAALSSASEKTRKQLTGWKDLEKIEALPHSLANAPVMPAMERYSGVGFQYLDIESLKEKERTFLDNHTIIFSNLLGPLRGSDMIPETKLKQTTKLNGIHIPNHYREHTSDELHTLIANQPVLDLRAKAYTPFYQPKSETIECVFLKNGKTVSHWSKAYRGRILRAFAQHQPKTVEAFLNLKIEGLSQTHVEKKRQQTIVTYEIT